MKILYLGAICSLLSVASAIAIPNQSHAQPGSEPAASKRATPTPKSTPIVLPTLAMEGQGQIDPQSGTPCSSTSCPGTLTATLSGRPFGKVDLTLNLKVSTTADTFTGCYELDGSGNLNNDAYSISIVGQVCRPNPGVGYVLSGTVGIFSSSSSSGTAATGTLTAFGGTNTPPNGPIPSSGPSVVNIVGSTAKIPVLIP